LKKQIQTKLNRFNTLLTKALQQHNQALFSLSVGALLELQDLLFSTSKTTPTEASTELLSEISAVDSSEQTTDQTTEQNTINEESD
jgi:hypothetical protein